MGLDCWDCDHWILCFFILVSEYLGKGIEGTNTGLIGFFDPLSQTLKGQPASEWFVYGTLYTLAILIFGFKFILKYRHNTYQLLRTISVMFFQIGFAFLLPEILQRLNQPYYDFKNMWPLNYYFFYDWNIEGFLNSGNIGLFMLVWGVLMIFLISPVLTYFYGKRWYCSWVCGCGGLAETAGDPFRHLSDKSLKAWKIERWLIYSVLVFAVVMTVAVLFSFFSKNPDKFVITKTAFLVIVIAIMAILAGIAYRYRNDLKDTGKYIYPNHPIHFRHHRHTYANRLYYRQLECVFYRQLFPPVMVWLCRWGSIFRSGWCGFLPADGIKSLVSFWMSDGCDFRNSAKIIFPIPNHHKRGAMHFLR